MSDRDSSQRLFSKLVFNSDSEFWNEFDLPKLRILELHTLAQLIGAPYSGRKDTVRTLKSWSAKCRAKSTPVDWNSS